ncbi:MAG TPA: anti-sigma regulatory factor [Usitatibacter sp.]|jgi:serine/threonine-protein kinase RsbT|nr:anti-sigma regulatory factor [Usitatibacter sp.]
MATDAQRVERSDELALRSGEDVVRLRQAVRERAVAVGLSLVDQTKIVTAASEIGRNTVQYGGGGIARIAIVANGTRRGLRLEFSDHGPGIADIAQALQDGFTTGGGLGLGLSGAKRLCDEFHIESEVGKGTRVSLVRWKPY